MKGLGDMMKQAQQMQENMQKMQDDLKNMEVEGQSGAGLVKVIMTGKHDIKDVQIDGSLMTEEKSLIEDLLAAAVNDAVRKVEQESQEKMSAMTGGIKMPPGFNMPF